MTRASSRARAVLLALLALCLPAGAGAAFLLNGEGRFAVLEREISYRMDPGPNAPFEALLADAPGWIPQQERPFRGDGTPVALWARFDLPAVQEPRRIMLLSPRWERIEYRVLRDGVLVDRQLAGTMTPLAERKTRVTMLLNSAGGFVETGLLPGTRTTVVARFETRNAFERVEALRVSLWDAGVVREGERRDRLGQGVFLGVMLFLIVYNLGLFAVVREPSFAYYVIMESGFTCSWLTIFGIPHELLWPGHPHWDLYLGWLSAVFGGFGLYQFLRHYLGTAERFPLSDRFLKWFALASLAIAPVVFLPVDFVALYAFLLFSAPVGVALVLAVVILALRARHPLARNLFLAMLCFGGGMVVFSLGNIAEQTGSDLVAHAGQIGSVLAGIVLSIGLGYRLQHMRTELVNRRLGEERLRGAHEREKRELIEEQNRTLEAKVVERTAALAKEQERANALLANILPQAVIEELREKGETEPRRHEEVSILFTDFSGFTQAVGTMPPRRLVRELDEIFRAFDDIVAEHGLEKIKTIGDAYMCASGLPVSAADHAIRCVRAALALVRFIETRNERAAMKWGLRLGIHSGAVVTGVVGKNKYAYDVWGDTVNIASRLESAGEVGRVNISAYTCDLVRDRFECEYRGKVAAKGKGEIDMYFVTREILSEASDAE